MSCTNFPRKRIVTTVLVVLCLTACQPRSEGSKPTPAEESVAAGEQDALTERFAQVFNWADQTEIAASVADFADRDTVRHPVHMLRNAFDEARRLSDDLDNDSPPAPEAESAFTERLSRLRMFLDQAEDHIREAEALVDEHPIDGVAVESEADAVKIAIDMAAVEHVGLLDLTGNPPQAFPRFELVRPRHQLAINYTGMIHETEAMRNYTASDWPQRWHRGSEIIRRSLASARTALRDLGPGPGIELGSRYAELEAQNRTIGELMFALRTELAKPVPDHDTASRELASAQAAIGTADQIYRSLVETHEAIPYPEYDFGQTN
jgi:hypothetical protein